MCRTRLLITTEGTAQASDVKTCRRLDLLIIVTEHPLVDPPIFTEHAPLGLSIIERHEAPLDLPYTKQARADLLVSRASAG
jgi:hypothetical protein